MLTQCAMFGGVLGYVMPAAFLLLLTLGIAALGKYLFTPRTGATS